ncbi:MAG TPA: T9SS type A sorting domain-containing protein [Bacteroidia bacterium]|nr:T9SS type A sorting domain-containing protein [Bacteroidia bacterium]
MIKRLIKILLPAFLLPAIYLNSQTVTFQQEFDMPGQAVMNTWHVGTLDGGMMVSIRSYNPTTSIHSLTFVKTSAAGTPQWTKHFSPVSPEFDNFVQTADSGYFVCYTNYNTGLGTYQVLKLNAAGNVVFSNELTAPNPFAIIGRTQTVAKNDGGFYIVSDLFDTITTQYLWHVFELNSSGNLLWSHCYNVNAAKGYHADLDTCQNGDILLAGTLFDPVTSIHSTVITRIAPGGTELWTKQYSSAGKSLAAISIVCMPGDYFMILGSAWNSSNFQNEILLMRTDGQGNVIWTFTFSDITTSLESHTLERAESNRTVLLGTMATGSFIIKTDTSGLMLCRRSYPGMAFLAMDTLAGSIYSFTGINFTSSNCVLVTTDQCGVGCADSLFTVIKTPLAVQVMPGGADVVVPLTDSVKSVPTTFHTVHVIEICNTVGIDEPINHHTENVYPIPASNTLRVESSGTILSVELIDINGKIIRTTTVSSASFDLDVSDLAEGIYFLRMHGENETSSRKIIIQH